MRGCDVPAIVDAISIDAKAVQKALDKLPAKLRKNALRRALYQAAVLVRDEARRLAPKRSGFLRRQIVARAGSATATGAMRSYVTIAKGRFYVDGVTKTGKLRWKKSQESVYKLRARGGYINPRRYAHLVEFGTRYSAAHPFLGPAARLLKREAVQRILAAKIREALK